MDTISSNDFKYFIQDISKIYLGANYTYEDILNHDDITFKFKMAVNAIFIKETGKENSIAHHLAVLKDKDASFLAYHQLKIKIKVTFLSKNDTNSKLSMGFRKDYCNLDEFIQHYQERLNGGECFIEEICIKKLHLAAFTV